MRGSSLATTVAALLTPLPLSHSSTFTKLQLFSPTFLSHPLHTCIPPVDLTSLTRMSATTSVEAAPSPITDERAGSWNGPAAPSSEPLPPKQPDTVQLGNLAANIMPHILNLYNCTATAADFEMYEPKATFEDPVMQAHGVKQIKSAFYSIPKVFKDAKMVEYTVTEVESAPNSGEVSIDNLQRYKVGSRTIDVVSLIKLQVENGKVVRHVDMWNKKPLLDRDSVKIPLMGRLVEKLRRGNMLVTHLFMGGKDPKPHS